MSIYLLTMGGGSTRVGFITDAPGVDTMFIMNADRVPQLASCDAGCSATPRW